MNGETEQAVAVLKTEATGMVAWAGELVVATKQDADGAMLRLAEIKGLRKRWTDYWTPLKTAANATWKAIVAKEKEGTDVVDRAEATVKQKVLSWQSAERVKAEAEQRRLQAIADEQARRERERLEKEAAKLKTPEKRAERMEAAAAVVAPVVTIAPQVAEAASTSTRSTWKAEVSDMAALIAAAVPGSVAASLLAFDQKAGDAFARATKGRTPVAGVRFVAVESLSVRAA